VVAKKMWRIQMRKVMKRYNPLGKEMYYDGSWKKELERLRDFHIHGRFDS